MELLERFTFVHHGSAEVYTAQRAICPLGLDIYIVMWTEGKGTTCVAYPLSNVETMVKKGYWIIQN